MKFDSVSNATSHQCLHGRAFPVSILINPLVMKQVDVTEFQTRGALVYASILKEEVIVDKSV